MVTEPQTIEGFALSDQQEHLWLLQAGHDAAYHAQGLYLLEGNLDTDLLQRALELVLSRYEILRTRFSGLEGMDLPLQIIASEACVPMEQLDLSGLADDAQQAQTDALYERVRNSPLWNADQLPLQTHLITLGCRRHLLLVRLPALCADASTLRNLMHEIRRCYAACAGEALESEESLQYVDYTQWQQEVTTAERAHIGLKHWQQDWSGDRSSELPFTRLKGGEPSSFQPTSLCIDLDIEAVRSIQEQMEEDVSVREVLFSSWLVLLWRLMGGEGLTVAAACDGRKYSELHSGIGLYEKYLPIRLSLMGEQSMADVVRKARLGLLNAYRFQDYFSWKTLGESASGSRQAPGVGFAFAYEVEASPERITGDLAISLPRWCVVSDRFCVRLSCIERAEVLTGELHYDQGRVSESDARRLGEALGALMSSAAADAHAGIATLNLLSCEEREQLLVEWNATAVEYAGDRCVHELFEEQVQRTPQTVAVVYEEEQLTYAELNRRANRLAHYLQTLGVGSDVRVGLCLERSVDLIVGLLGILKAGGAYVPLDPALPQERRTWMLNDSGAKVLLTHQALVEVADASTVCVCVDRDAHQISRHSEHNPPREAQAHHLVYVIYTSGSTGRPKGVGVEHRHLLNYVLGVSERLGLKADASYASVSTLAADLGNTMVFPSLCLGGCLHLISSERAMDGVRFGEYLCSHRIDYLKIVPSHLGALLGEGAQAAQRLPREVLVLGGEASSWELVAKIREASPGLRVFNHYGPTETTVGVLTHAVELAESSQTTPSLTVPLGRPLPNTQVYVLNAYLQPVPVGVVGELYIGGAGVSRGYLGHEELTQERFVSDRFSGEAGARLYRTGDLCRYLSDGNVEFVGRVDHQVKIRGFRIELGEIESVLLSHPEVREAVVEAREDVAGEKRLVGYVVGQAGSVSVSALRAYLGEKLPEYMVPSAWVVLEQLPLTSNGKVDRNALAAPESAGQEEDYVGARTPVEEGLAQIWGEVLRVDEVGVHTSFFALGGHSLLATQVISRIRNTFAVELPLRALFEAPTIAGLAERIGRASGSEGSGAPALVRVSREGRLPLSFAQQRLWFIDQMEPESCVYNIPMALRLSGPLDVAALEQSLQEIVLRHEALRTTFAVAEGEPVQVIHDEVALTLSVVDLSTLAAQEREREAQRLITEEVQRPFDLCVGPLFRFGVLRLGEAEHVLLLTLHHIVSDGWSQGVLRRELQLLYNAFHAGRPSPLSELAIQYADYAAWQREWLQGEPLQRQVSYWKERLNGAPTLLELPTDRPRPPVQTFRGARVRHEFSAELTAGVKALGQREGTTLFMTLLAAFQTLLARYSRQDDIVLGTPIANRTHSEIEGVIGFFVNTLVLRGDLSGDPSFVELLGRVREVCLGGYAHQDLPFEKLVEELQPQRSLSHTPVFQVLFSLANAPGSGLGLEGVEIAGMGSEGVSAKFDLSLILSERSGQLWCTLEYNTDLFDADRIARMLGHLEVLLAGIVSDPQQKVSRLPLLTQAEREQLVVDWNATDVEYPRDRCIHELFEEQVERTPDAVAVVFEDQQLTYAQLNARANRLAHFLRAQGVGPEVLVGLHLQRSIEMVVGLLGVLKAGGAYVPLDPSYPPDRLAFMLQDAQVRMLLTQASLEFSLPPASMSSVSALTIEEAEGTARAQPEYNPSLLVSGEHLAYMIYTSGSTGQPKGALNTHRAIRNRLLWMQEQYALDGSDRVLQKTPFSFDVSVWEFLWPLLSGACLVVARPEGHKDPSYLAEVIRSCEITTLHFVPSMLRVFVEASEVESCVSLRRVICSGEALPLDLTQRFFGRLGGVALHNLYGPTEAAVDVTYYACSAEEPGSSIPIGRPIANTQIYILDRCGGLVPVGVPGELYIGGVNVGRGYHNRPELSAEKFVVDPFVGDGVSRMYRTGDLCRYLVDGNIEYLGRLDYQVKVRGFRIELGEIESVLLSHPSVRDAVVLAREEASGEKRLVGYVVSEVSETAPSVSELRAYLGEKLPEYMLPSAWVVLEQLPLTSNGKVDRNALAAPESQVQDEGYVGARTPVEEGLAQIWQEILRVDEVGVHTSFFALGGHSLLATQVISRIRNTFAVELPLRALFEAPTIAGLAERIGRASGSEGSGAPALVRVSREGRLPLSFAQQRLWFIDQMEPESCVYNIPMALRLSGPLDVAALEQSLHEIVLRHEALRTTFAVAEGEPVQVIHDEVALTLSVVDLSTLAAQEREREAQRLITEEVQRPFDLQRGPLFRFGVLRLGEAEHILLLTLHHIVSDGWSQGVLRRELQLLYNAFHAGRPSPLSELAIQYADYAAWQREWLQGEPLQRQVSYWKERLNGAPTLLELPTDRPRPPVQTFRGARVRREFSSELTAGVKALGQREGTTLFMTLLAAFQTLLARYSRQDDIVLGTPIANRTHSEIEGVIGFFVNTLVLRGDLSGDPSFVELLGRVREVCLGGYAHQDLPFEKLVEELQPQRSLSHTPVFQVLFSLANAPGSGLGLEGVEIAGMGSEGVSAKFDLSLILSERSGQLWCTLEYNTDLFDADRMERMLGHLEVLLAGIVSDPQQKVSRLPLLTQAEREQLVVDWNATDVEYPRDRCIHELFEEQVERTPDAVAVVFEDQQLTYAQLNARANRLAHFLRAQGVGPDVLVGLCLERSIQMIVGTLGILKAGGAYVPLDPSYPTERLAFMLQDCHAMFLLTLQRLRHRLKAQSARILCLDTDASLQAHAEENLSASAHSDNLAYVIYTSGSTGQPKGVGVCHQSLLNLVNWHVRTYDLRASDRSTQVARTAFDASVWEVWPPLAAGASLCIAGEDTTLSPQELIAWLLRSEASIAFLPTPLAEAVLAAPACESLRLRALLTGGDRLHRVGNPTLAFRLLNHYGPTESTVVATAGPVVLGEQAGAPPIGRPIDNTHLYVLDAQRSPVPVGVAGELYIGGESLARGYVNRAELTAEKFVPDPFSREAGARLYRTGDLCRYLSDGTVEFVGRVDDQVKIRGFRIELGEIESVLLSHPEVREAVVVAQAEASGAKRLVGYVVGHAASVSVSALREYLGEKLPQYMIPSAFVFLAALPLSANGKVDRKALPAPDGVRPEVESGYQAPHTAAQKVLAKIWQDVLRLQQVGIHDNFFELGGDSILSIQIIARANAAGLRLTPRQVFQHQTIAGLASVAGTAPQPHSQQGNISGPVALTPIQHRFFEQDLLDAHHYNQARLLVLDPSVTSAHVAQVVSVLVSHHDALRLRFVRSEQGWQQSNAAHEEGEIFSCVDLSGVAQAEHSVALTSACAQLQASLDLCAGPMLRVAYFEMGGEKAARLLWTIHHLCVDGVSWRVLLEDLQRGLEQAIRGEEIVLPAKTTSFQHWSERLSAYARSEELGKELGYWQGLAHRGKNALTSEQVPWEAGGRLPVDFAEGENTLASQRVVRVGLSVEETRALLQDVPSVYHTQINDVLLTALGQALSEWTGERRVWVDLEGHGREAVFEEGDVSRTVGWFTSLYPVALEWASWDHPGEALKAVKETLRCIPGHGIGYGVLRYLSEEEFVRQSLSEVAAPEVSFNYHGHLDQVVRESGLLSLASEGSGASQSGRARRTHLLDVIGVVREDRLELRWVYSEHRHDRATIEGVAGRYAEALRSLIAHCACADAGGYTPSDFAKAPLSQLGLDRLLSGMGWTRGSQIEDIYTLSPMQAGMLFHTLYAAKARVYQEHLFYTLHGDFNTSAFERAWQHLLERHGVLRTSFHWEGLEEPVQVVHAKAELALEYRDWRGLCEQEQKAGLQRFLKENRAEGMDLSRIPLTRLTLLRTGSETWQFVWAFHHLLLDRWSVSQVMSELSVAYAALCAGREIELPAVRAYGDYIGWLQEQDKDRAQAYWRRTLAGFNAPTSLPLDKAPGGLSSKDLPRRESVRLSEEASSALQSLARQHRLTLNTLVQGAWALLLSRYSGEEDVLFGATVSGRPGSLGGVESMVGLFINSLPVRVQVAGSACVIEWLQQLQEQLLELREYEYSSLVEIRSWSEVPRGVPMFESLVVVQNTPVAHSETEPGADGEQAGGLPLRAVDAASSVDFPLYLTAVPGRQIGLSLSYDASRYEQADIGRLLGHIERLLEGIVADPEQKVSRLSMLSELEREQLLVEWNATDVEYPRDRCVHELFEEQVARTPNAVSVSYAGQRLTYDQLNQRANQLAHYLRRQGVGPNVLVGLYVEPSLDMVVGLLGILKAGGAYVPMDARYPQERIAHILADSRATVLLIQTNLMASMPEYAGQIVVLDDRTTMACLSDTNVLGAANATDAVYVIYTSGSTGLPKGVVVTHRNLVSSTLARRTFYSHPPTKFLLLSSLAFDSSVAGIFWTLCEGGCLVLPTRPVQEDLHEILDQMASESISHYLCVPTLHKAFLEECGNRHLGSLRTVIVAGEECSSRLVSSHFERLAQVLLFNEYGPTEATVWASVWRASGEGGPSSVPIGRPISNVALYVLDVRLHPVPVGVVGELYIGGAGVSRSYLNRAALTAEKFVPDRFSGEAGARLYRTGDLCRYLSDGNVEFVGRLDHQVKIRGFRIELGEIESVLLSHPQVREAVVEAREDVAGDKRLVGYVVGQAGSVSVSALRAYLGEKLPEYMLPSAWVVLEQLPLTSNGKVDRKALPPPESQGQDDAYVGARTPIEEGLAQIWGEVLRVDEVGVHTSFFALGGHSLLATQVISRIRSTFAVELPLRALFEAPTIAGLAERIGACGGSESSGVAPLVRVSREGRLPLSFAQQRLWFIDQLEPQSCVYNIPMALRLSGPLNVPALESSLNELLRRHEPLRTVFAVSEGEPGQVIEGFVARTLRVTNLSSLEAQRRTLEARRLITEEAQRPFDLCVGPLFRFGLLRLQEEEHILLLSLHHIVSDGWSQGVLTRELTALYHAFNSGTASPLPELPIQYADYAVWQREWLQGEELQRQLSYWKERLGGAPTLLKLPTDRPRPPLQTFRGARVRREFSSELTVGVKALGQREGTTLFMTLLAAFQTLLARYSHQDDIVVGTPIANRTQAEVEGLIGFFVNTLVLRADLSGDPSFVELLGRVREVCLRGYAHQDLPFEKLVEELQPQRSLSHSPVFQVLFSLANAPRTGLGLEGVEIAGMGSEGVSAKFDLSLILSETNGKLGSVIAYNTDLFDADRIERMLGHLEVLLEGIVSDPQQKVSRLPLLTQAEREQLVVDWNATAVEYPRDRCIHELFEEQVERTPDADAVAFENQTLTYRQLNAQSNRLAHHLKSLGVGPDVRVGLCLDRSIEMIVGLLGILKAGGAYVPLDPALPQERRTWMLNDSGAKVLLTHQALVEVADASTVCVCVDRDVHLIDRHSEHNPPREVQAHHLVYVIYTSGSTGRPKGVGVEHRHLLNYVLGVSERLGLKADASYASVSTLAADLGNTMVFPSLCLGGCLHLISSERAMDGVRFGEYLCSHRIDYLKIVPSHLWALLGEGAQVSQQLPREVLVLGGEASSWELVAKIQEACPGLRVFNHYGPTETTVGVLTHAVELAESSETTPSLTVPLGRPLPNSRVYVLNAYLQPVPVGVVGELYIGGAGVSRGYLGHEELTQERFVSDRFSGEAGARLYRTGDLCRYLSDGNVEFVGRVDHQVKIRGFRIELGEIESVLLSHPEVREAVVEAREDVGGEKRLVGYVVGQTGSVSVSALRAHLGEKLPEYMVPSAWVVLEQLPLTPNGKVDRKALAAPESAGQEEDYVGARTPIEEGLAEIWGEVLRVDEVGVHTSFFALGGHSLLATQVISRIRNTFAVELPLRALFEAPTIAGLAERIGALGESEGSGVPPLVRVSREGRLPLSFAQQRLWFIDQLEPNSPLYNVPTALRLTGNLNRDALEHSLNELVRRHESLRTVFAATHGEPAQVIREYTPFQLAVNDLSTLGSDQREHKARDLIAQEAQRPFTLAEGPLFRCALLRLGDQEHILMLTLHHTLSDAWSRRVLMRELAAFYKAFLTGKPCELPDLPIQYADYAVWQRQWLDGAVLAEQLAYWKEQLDGAPALLELPTDRPRPAVQTYRGARAHRALPEPLSQALKQLGHTHGTTLFMSLLAAFQVLLYRYSGQDQIVVGTPIANRSQSQLEGLIGFFMNTLALRADLSGEPSFRQLLARVRKTALGAYAHQDIPFEKLVEELQPQRSLSRSPIFQVMFTLQTLDEADPTLAGLHLTSLGSEGITAKSDLLLSVTERGGRLHIGLEYNTDLFYAQRMQRLLEHFQTLLEGIVANVDQPICRLVLLSDPERQELLMECNDTSADYPRACMHQLFEEQVERTPDAVAVEFEERHLTYTQLNQRANQLAHWLREHGVGPDTLVGLYLDRGLDLLVGLLGILKAGGAYVPLDPSYPTERIAFMLQDCEAGLLLTQYSLLASLSGYAGECVCLDLPTAQVRTQSMHNLPPLSTLEDLVYVIYTSGSTGQPKGVMIEQGSVVNLLTFMRGELGIGETDVVVNLASYAFDMSVPELYLPLISGGRLVLVSRESARSGSQLLGTLKSCGATVVHATPSTWELILEAGGEWGRDWKRISGAEALSVKLATRLLERGSHLYNFYGPTETTVWSTFHRLGDASEAGVLGRPVANTQVYVLDAHQQLVPLGVPGELYLGGAGVARGYLKRAELSEERFVASPFSDDPEVRLYRTGDRVCWRMDRQLEFVGRVDDQVKIRGFRIELGEIEAVLLLHPGIREAVVVAREDEPGEKRLVGYVVGHAASVSVSALREHLGAKLPEYMLPSAWVVLEQLPLTPNGKVDRKALPPPESAGQDEGYVAPRTPIEEGLAEIWGEVLRLEQVGVHTSFFALGGHSLLATQVISRIRNTFSVELPLRALFEAPTIAGLAAHIGEAGGAEEPGAPGLVRVSREGRLPLSFAQQRLWFIDQWEPGSSVYNIPLALRLTGSLDVAALQQSLQDIVLRHEALRTTFAVAEGEPIQVIHEGVTTALSVVDLSSLEGEEREREARRRITEEAQRPFDLARGPLLRAGLLRLQETEHVLLLTLHHIVSDGWSQGVLRREVSTLYNAFRNAQPSPLPALPIQYADYALWQRHWLQGEPLQRQVNYWKAQMAGAPPVLNLPTDRPAPRVRSYSGERLRLLIAREHADRLRELGRQERATQFMILLAVFDVLLYRYTNQTDLVVGTDIANRNHADTERLIGFFVNHLVLRTDLSGNPTFRELLGRVRKVCLGAYAHQDLPFDTLVEVLRPERSTSHTPLFQVLFVMTPPAPNFTFDTSLSVSSVNVGVPTSKYDLGLFVSEGTSGLSTSWVYQTDLFDAQTIRGMAADFEALVGCVASAPDTPLAQLEVLLLNLARRRLKSERAARRQMSRSALRADASGTGG